MTDTGRDGMTHDEAHALLLDLAYGELPPDVGAQVSRHAAVCAGCSAELARIEAVRAAARRLEDPAAPSSREPLLAAARRAVATRPPTGARAPARRRWLARPAARSFAAAAAALAVVAGVTLQVLELRQRRAVDELVAEPPPAPRPGDLAPADAPLQARPAPSIAAPTDEPERPAGTPAPTRARPARPAPAPLPPAPPSAPAPTSGGAALAAPAGAAASPAPAEKRAVPRAETGDEAPRRPEPAVGRRTESSAAPAARAAAQPPPTVEDVERRLRAGELDEAVRSLRCGAVPVTRTAAVTPGGRIVKVTERRGDAVREAWYDDAGHLRAARSGDGPVRQADMMPGLPSSAPDLAALGTCQW